MPVKSFRTHCITLFIHRYLLITLYLVILTPITSHAAPAEGWSYKKVVQPTVPTVKDSQWCKNPIDNFIVAKLEAANLTPQTEADKRTLLRRAYYDLTGLAPTIAQQNAFIADNTSNAFEKVIDTLLASNQYGVKWGRHWLDLVRYGETRGYERDLKKPHIWRYRDYVVNAFNNDKPYDDFIKEQIAGDEFRPGNSEALIATGYQHIMPLNDEPADKTLAHYDFLDSIVSNVGQVFLASSVGCARCHDHKKDPIKQKDYYNMVSFFHNIPYKLDFIRPIFFDDATFTKYNQENKAALIRLAEVSTRKREMQKALFATLSDRLGTPIENFEGIDNFLIKHKKLTVAEKTSYKLLIDELESINKAMPQAPGQANCIAENGPDAPDTFLLRRGNPALLGEKVQPAFISTITPPDAPMPTISSFEASTGRRLVLANWIANKDNQLTTRTIVNRIWHYHFGRGIVDTPNEFGNLGSLPTHDKLLDWLAADFVKNGWTLKRMHKLMMMSSTYQMSANYVKASYDQDPSNKLFWRFNMRRLTAEEIRDSILQANGSLNLKQGGMWVFPTMPADVLATASKPEKAWGKSTIKDAARRSIYIHVKRSLREPFLASFDQPDTDSTCAVRFTSTQPTQALTTMNSDFITQQASVMATRMIKEKPNSLKEQVAYGLQLAFNRPATDNEITRGVNYATELSEAFKLTQKEMMNKLCLMILNTNEFIYLN